ncbi:K+-transporting ATPase ATPase C chain [Neorhizobium sp. R1-B]|jgi:potassium-transporting ATPase KdpC subunit|uniref:potassium-transporting ATPase subunit KdpC n=1 Tax=unclassified Neorhizobium TaxID=2629175 RepID=UPI001047441F|nr:MULTISPECIES: potassium-transporting ATPase subunit KdpC [unclassified Neorhizobium]TCV73821.1 K+-transporting ATPase ATPase C chain [Neorhizobium sp. S3-V5DH]TDX85442.1 K+-transporting ATPase ATPase C chain [Neorhizobium sp. R1-B]
MLNHLRPALTLVVALTALTGLAYPLAINSIAQAVMPAKANGSLIERDGTVIGSVLIGQNFTSDRYFWPRPSATDPDPYNAAASSGSNLGTTSVKLKDRVVADVERLKGTGLAAPVPGDAVTASGSGLDPHISPPFAEAQVARIAQARGLQPTVVAELVARSIENPAFGIIGEARVNVLELNLALDALKM